jgi:hypothetical protein
MRTKKGLIIAMKNVFPAVIALAALVSCQKQQTEVERNAEVERQVQERLAAEHQTEQQQKLAQQQADLEAREKALAEKENAAAAGPSREQRAESEAPESRVRVPAPRQRAISVGYSTFYNKLEPYGDWIETGDYGYVFHPRQAESSRSWRPYTNGRWVYSDAGWTWISEEPFGWATYHYGRWTRLRGIGWVWVPGNQWAPAWVSWRKSSEYVGWAPLPPEARFDQRTGIHNWSDNYYDIGPDQYSFVASREFGAPRVEQTLLPPERNVTIINQTTNVTNITYNNTTIVNEGPSYDEVRSVSREPMQRYRLERNADIDVSGEPRRSEVRGETVFIAAPVFSEPVANERPATVKQTIAAVAVDLGWEAIADHEAAKKTRAKMKSEATAPSNAPSKKFVKAETAASGAAQSSETSTATTSTSTTATPAPTAAATATPVASAAPLSTTPPRRAATFAPPAAASATSSPISAASVSPAASQRRGRLLVPSATPSPRTMPSATPQPTAANSPVATNSVPSTPIPSASPVAPAGSGRGANPRARFQSPRPNLEPRHTELMSTASPVPSATTSSAGASREATSTSSSQVASTPAPSAPEKLTKQELKQQKREERKELKRERREGAGANATASPSVTPP